MKLKQSIACLLAAASLTGMLAACGQAPGETASSSASASSGQPVTESSGTLLADEPTTFSIFLVNAGGNQPFNSEWPVWQEIGKRTNIYLEGVVPQSNSDAASAFNTMLASGDLADIIAYQDVGQIEQLGRDGGLIPLNDLIDEYAPNIKKVLEENPSFAQTAYSLDGNIYQIPRLQEIFSAEYWWIRQDWLDKLDLETPETVDDLYNVLTAFRNEDPNGNGIKDEVPLFDRAGAKMPDEYLYLWDTSTGFYVHDGKMVFEPLEENFKTGVTNIAKWYAEGLIDPELFTRQQARDVLLSGDLGGCTHDWVSAGGYEDKLQETIPDFKMVAFAPPANQHGEVYERTCRQPNIGWGISSQCEDPVTVMKFFDYIFSEEGTMLVSFGVEGSEYTVQPDGSIKYTDAVMNAPEGAVSYLRSKGAACDIGRIEPAEYEYATMTTEGEAATKLYNDHPEWYREEPPFRDGEMYLKYLPEDEDEYQKIMANITPYVDEKFQSWMMGTSDFEAEYEEFVAELKNRGIVKAIEINQRAYDAFVNHNG